MMRADLDVYGTGMPHPSPESDRLFSIGVIAGRTGLRVSAIRYYESVGLIEPARRISGRRMYDQSVFESIALVRLAHEAGFTVAEIRELVGGSKSAPPASARWQALAQRKLADVVDRIERAQRMKELLERLLRCRVETFGECVQAHGARFGDVSN
jgi:MerR family redox-sensitive transcriptional activator SoxR